MTKRKENLLRYFATFMLLNILFEVVSPSVALALTNGPLQPEALGFEQAGSSEMVDLFSGDFSYNIPLLDVDGYPVNLAYHAGQSGDNEASWVGLGWSLSPGVLNRIVKGVPDDFNGDVITATTSIKPMTTMGIGLTISTWVGVNASTYGAGVGEKIGFNVAAMLIYNSYKGFGLEVEQDSHSSSSNTHGFETTTKGAGRGTQLSTQEGGTRSATYENGKTFGIPTPFFGFNTSSFESKGSAINTRSGLITEFGSMGTSVGGYISIPQTKIGGSGSFGRGGSYSMPSGPVSYQPGFSYNYSGGSMSRLFKVGLWGKVTVSLAGLASLSVHAGVLAGLKFTANSIMVEKERSLGSYGYLYAENATHSSLQDFNRFRDGAIFEETPNTSYSSRTFDYYCASAQGLGMTFRPHRSDIGTVHDPLSRGLLTTDHNGTEVGGPAILHLLTDNSSGTVVNKSHGWDVSFCNSLKHNTYNNLITPTLTSGIPDEPPSYTGTTAPFIEKAYFKEVGEINVRDEVYEASVKEEDLLQPTLKDLGAGYEALSPILGTGRQKRDVRTTYIESLTAGQAKKHGFEKTFSLYDKNSFSINSSTKLVSTSSNTNNVGVDRTLKNSSTAGLSNYDIENHLSEFSMTNASGDRYVYGIPSYNLKKRTVIFNASDRTQDTYNVFGTLEFPKASFTYTNPLEKSDVYQLCQYASSTETGLDRRGEDNLSQIQNFPAYASSYLLTNILAPDYVDVTGNGPSYDDLGHFTKFNYLKDGEYKWREPFSMDATYSGTLTNWQGNKGTLNSASNQAIYDKGLICDELDDKGFYQYGVRENYYMHSIETKNFVAVFKTSGRRDGFGVQDDAGLMDTTFKSLKLDTIILYSKNEILAKGGVNSAIPIKKVVFEYDYSMCPGTFNTVAAGNSLRGKLTLKRLYFLNGKSMKSSLSPYEFKYADNDHSSGNGSENNYVFDPRANDRWGCYKPNSGAASGLTSGFNNVEFPYAIQNKTQADGYAAAWNLSEITTPTGATIKITYEADDYGFIQNEQAGQMLSIYNCVSAVNASVDVTTTYSGNATTNVKDVDYLIVDLSALNIGIPTSNSLSDADKILKRDVFKTNKYLYFKAFMHLAGPANSFAISSDYYDYVPGYASINTAGLFASGFSANTYTGVPISGSGTETYYKYAYVLLQRENAYSSRDVNPMTLAGWDFMRTMVSKLAYPGSEPRNMGDPNIKPIKHFIELLYGLAVAKMDMVNAETEGQNKRFDYHEFCSEIVNAKSMVRAYVPGKRKLGGGCRVKELTTDDNWSAMTATINTSGYSENSSVYKQTFEYTDTEETKQISSGVATYEPQFGGDEISLRQPVKFDVRKAYAPNDHFFQEYPLNEMLYPGAMVGYSKVTVKTISDPGNANVPGAGKSVFEFYTARDFPVAEETSTLATEMFERIPTIDKFIDKPDLVDTSFKYLYQAQGTKIRLNDMHGKLKSISVFGEDNLRSPISEVKYFYKSEPGEQGRSKLTTSVSAIDDGNVITPKVMARDIDVTADSRENISETNISGSSTLFEMGLLILIVPLPAPPYIFATLLPGMPSIDHRQMTSYQRYGYRSATITKAIQEYGILDRIETTVNKTTTIQENLLWDAETGSVVLTKTSNHLNQDIYSFNYPAYWGYSEMGHEYKRDGIKLSCLSPTAATAQSAIGVWDVTTGTLSLGVVDVGPIFEMGDEVIVTDVTTVPKTQIGERFWIVMDPLVSNPTKYYLVDQTGTKLCTANYTAALSSHNYEMELIRPINRNKLLESMGGVTSLTDPQVTITATTSISYTETSQKIVDAYARTFCAGGAMYSNPLLSDQKETNVPPVVSTVIVNPIIAGYYGNQVLHDNMVYRTDRSYSVQPTSKADGLYGSFNPFWTTTDATPHWKLKDSPPTYSWVVANSNEYYSPYGYLLQSNNSIGVRSSQRFGYNHTLPVLTAYNASADDVGFDGFEEYTSNYPAIAAISSFTNYNANVYNNDYLGFYGQSTAFNPTATTLPTFTNNTSHTGRYSLYFAPSQTVNLVHATNYVHYDKPGTVKSKDNLCEITIPPCGCLDVKQVFNCSKLNLKNKPYVISYWVKTNGTATLDCSGLANLTIKQNTIVTNCTPVTKSGIIDGWQKLDYEFEPTGAVTSLTISINSGSSTGFYLDDFRIQPFNSSMTCYVYDPWQLRLTAQLDDQNYATVYEYNNEGILVRKNKETTKGIYTLKESRNGTYKR